MTAPLPADRPTRARFVLLAWMCAAAACAYLQRNSIVVAEEAIRTDLGLSLDEMGWVMSSFFLAYGFLQIPAGWLGRRWGTRRLLPLYCVGWSLATALMAAPGGFVQLLVLRFSGGAAQAGLFPCTTQTTSRWFSRTERGLTSGFLASFMSVGGAAGTVLAGLLLPHWGWRPIFFAYAAPGLLWSILFYRWFRERPEEHPRVNAGELAAIHDATPPATGSAAGDGESTPWRAILRSPTMWWINAQHFFRGAGYIFYATWFATFLKETRGVSVKDSGLLTSLPLLAVVFGSPLGGMLSDQVLRRTGSLVWARQGVAISSMLGCALLIVLSYFVDNPWGAVLVISAGSLCAAIGGPCSYAITMDVGGKHVAPVFSMMNMWGNFGSLLFPIIVPRLVRWTGRWDAVLFLFAAIYVAAAISWLGANPKKSIW